MRLSTAVRYGARAVVQVASADPDRAVSVREVAEQQKILRSTWSRSLDRCERLGWFRRSVASRGGMFWQGQPRVSRSKISMRFLSARLRRWACEQLPRFLCDVRYLSHSGYVGRDQARCREGTCERDHPGSRRTQKAEGDSIRVHVSDLSHRAVETWLHSV